MHCLLVTFRSSDPRSLSDPIRRLRIFDILLLAAIISACPPVQQPWQSLTFLKSREGSQPAICRLLLSDGQNTKNRWSG